MPLVPEFFPTCLEISTVAGQKVIRAQAALPRFSAPAATVLADCDSRVCLFKNLRA